MRILVTAGPTREPIDPVRYITNRSSGRMGYALAGAAAHEGHHVILVSGPTSLDVPPGVDFIPVETAQEMYDTVRSLCDRTDIAILCAAVADYRPIAVANQKIKKTGDKLTLELKKTPDILGSMRSDFGYTGILVGFAAETQNIEQYAHDKLIRKQCDLIVANDVSRKDIGFDSSQNEVLLITADGAEPLPKDTKEHIAMEIISRASGIIPHQAAK